MADPKTLPFDPRDAPERREVTELDWGIESTPLRLRVPNITDADGYLRSRARLLLEYQERYRRLSPALRNLPSPLIEFELLPLADGLKAVRVIVAFPPKSTNNLQRTWVNRRTGKVSRSTEDDVRQYKDSLVIDCISRAPDLYLPGYLAIDYRVFMRARRRGDLFNHEKLLTDALMIVLGNDDSRILSGTMVREFDPVNPRIEALFFQVPPPSWDEAEVKKLAKAERAAKSKAPRGRVKKTKEAS